MPHELEVDIVFIRHAEAISNYHDQQGGFRALNASEDDFLRLIQDVKSGRGGRVSSGAYLMDGLTSKGKEQAARPLSRPLQNVYAVVSSPCPRAFQTASLMAPNFELVGSQSRGPGTPKIHVDRRLREATPWLQDMEGLLCEEDGRQYTPYLEIRGGGGSDGGCVVGQAAVDFTNAIWRQDGTEENLQTAHARVETLAHPEPEEEVQARIDAFLEHEYLEGTRSLQEHVASGREGNPRRVWVAHGGIGSLLQNTFYCDYAKDAAGNWQWNGSAALENLGVRVFRLCLQDDASVVIKEKPWDAYYQDVFGPRYRHFESEPSLRYRQPDGSLVNQEDGYFDFFEDARDEAVAVAHHKRGVATLIAGWRGL